jgi:hypothetical protein
MSRVGPRHLATPLVAALVAATLALAPSADAKGGGGTGGGGGGTGGGEPPTQVDPCVPLVGHVYADGVVAGDFNLAGITGGCAVIAWDNNFHAVVEEVLPETGWTYVLDVRNQTQGTRVTVEYTQTSTGRRTSLMMEPGKTVVKQ